MYGNIELNLVNICNIEIKNLKIEISWNPAIPLLGIYPDKLKFIHWIDIHTPMLTAAFFIHSCQDMKITVSIDRWIDKENVG